MAMLKNLEMQFNIVWKKLKTRLFFVLWLLLDYKIDCNIWSHNNLKHHLFVRCTRRFTPGMCLDPVEPVWTFVFQLQNCTERLGCPPDRRVNRFKTYSKCMRRCKPLVNIYTEFLIQNPENLTDFYLRSKIFGGSGRREIDAEYYDTFDKYDEYKDKAKEHHIEGPVLDAMEYEDHRNRHDYTVDIDYVEREDNVQDEDEN